MQLGSTQRDPLLRRRLSQTLASVLAVSSFALTATSSARADDDLTTRVGGEVAGYTDTVAVSVFTPSVHASVESVTSGWGVNGAYLVDVVSAASPDIVATASPRWHEIRNAGNLGVKYKPGRFGIALGGAASYTPDYLALSGNALLTEELDDKNLTLLEGYSLGRDTIGRTGTPFSVFSHDLTTHVISLGLSRVVNESLVLGLYGDGIFELGDQSKPYRYIPMFAPDVAPTVPRGATAPDVANMRLTARPLEQLPLTRDRFAVSGRLGWRTDRTTLRLEQRLYNDSWLQKASTSDFRWFIDVGQRATIWPHVRVNVQSGVDFWQRAYAARDVHDLPALRTGDRELGPLASFGGGGGLRLALGKSGKKDDFILTITGDGNWTSFTDAIYVKNRFSVLGTSSVEVTF